MVQDTKSKIFNTSLRLFAASGYERVSVRMIADAVGIKVASIYNHFRNKAEILEACYEFYVANRYVSRFEKGQYEPIIMHGTKKDTLQVLKYVFPDSILENMILCLLIIFSRIYNDVRAKEIYADEINGAMQYLEEFLNFGIQVGRFDKFNVQAVALVILSSRLYTAHSVTIAPEQKGDWKKAEIQIFDELINIIPFKY